MKFVTSDAGEGQPAVGADGGPLGLASKDAEPLPGAHRPYPVRRQLRQPVVEPAVDVLAVEPSNTITAGGEKRTFNRHLIAAADEHNAMISKVLGCRIAVIGSAGSGKSTLSRLLSARLCVPHIELDALNWKPGWKALSLEDPERWSRLVAEAVAGDDWVTDGNYSKGASPHILPRATDVIWLDYSRTVIMVRVLRRSFLRALSGRELWPGTGIREDFRRWYSKEHPIRWTWTTYRSANDRREALFSGHALDHARKHRFRTPAATRDWLTRLQPP